MQKYNIEIIETLSRIEEIEAENEEQAREKIQEMYHNGDIVLIDDNVSTEFVILEDFKN
jgi:MinD-like ATPase involved in chromosome partitioning or flagellar assembly